MSALVAKRLINRDEYYSMWESGIIAPDEKVELVNGEIVQKMSPIGVKHASVMNTIINQLIALNNKNWWVIGQSPLQINSVSEPEPDILVAKARQDRYRTHHPTSADIHFLVEVYDSTLEYDQTTKKELYAVAGIPTYWVINLKANQVEVYSNPVGQLYVDLKVYGKGQQVPLPGTSDFLNAGDLL